MTDTANLINAGVSYSFKVSAVNSVGESPLSDEFTVIAATVPAAPATPTLVSQSQTLIQFSWNIPSDGGSPILGYIVYSDGGAGTFSALSPTITDVLTVSYDVTQASHGIVTGTVYQFNVIAYNAVGQSVASPNIAIQAATLPSPPLNLGTISSSSTSITFGWSVPADNGGAPVSDYKVYWNGGIDNNAFGLLSSTTLGFITYTFQTDIVAGTFYEFKVVAKNAIGDSSFSSKLRVIAASFPDAPISLSLVSQSHSSISFSWQDGWNGGSPILDYEVYWDGGNGGLAEADFTLLSSTTFAAQTFT